MNGIGRLVRRSFSHQQLHSFEARRHFISSSAYSSSSSPTTSFLGRSGLASLTKLTSSISDSPYGKCGVLNGGQFFASFFTSPLVLLAPTFGHFFGSLKMKFGSMNFGFRFFAGQKRGLKGLCKFKGKSFAFTFYCFSEPSNEIEIKSI